MELIVFIFGLITSISITNLLLEDRLKPLFTIKNKIKYEIITAIYVIGITSIIIKNFND